MHEMFAVDKTHDGIKAVVPLYFWIHEERLCNGCRVRYASGFYDNKIKSLGARFGGKILQTL